MTEALATNIIDGKVVAAYVRSQIKEQVDDLLACGKRPPGLAVILVGDDPASHVYVKNKVQACQKVGFLSQRYDFPADVSAGELLQCIHSLNHDDAIDGILVQLPLPKHLPKDEILTQVQSDKDVDGLHPDNLGKLFAGKAGLRPCTPLGVMALLDYYKVELAGKNAVVIGRSNLVGKPISIMLMEHHATVTICHSRTKDLARRCLQADILVVAAGDAQMVKGSWIKPAAVVIDVGTHRKVLPDGTSKLLGDVEFAEAQKVASLITPVPGGVGPMTIAMLLKNTISAYKSHLSG